MYSAMDPTASPRERVDVFQAAARSCDTPAALDELCAGLERLLGDARATGGADRPEALSGDLARCEEALAAARDARERIRAGTLDALE